MNLSDFKPGLVYEEGNDFDDDLYVWVVVDVQERNVRLTELVLVGKHEGKITNVTVPWSVLKHHTILSEGT